MSERPFIPNTFPTPNDMVDKVMQCVKGPAFKVLLVITRWTLGWHEWRPDMSVEISLKQLQEKTGLSRQGVIDAIKELIQLKLVVANRGPRNSRVKNSYTLNLDITTGELVHNLDQSKLLTTPTSPQIRPELVKNTDSLKYKLNTNNKAPVFLPHRKNKTVPPAPAQLRAFNSWYSDYPKHVGEKPAREAWLKLDPDPALVATIIAATARYVDFKADVEPRYVLDPAKWLNEEHWTDELPGAANKGHATPEVKDVGGGCVEVDGRRMDKRTAERRGFNAAT